MNETYGDVMRNTPPFLTFGDGTVIIRDEKGWLVAKPFDGELGMIAWLGNGDHGNSAWISFLGALEHAVTSTW